MKKLSKYEKETIINWNEAENLASVYTLSLIHISPLYLNVCPGAAGGVAPNYHPVAGVQVKDLCAGGAGRGVDPRLVVG